MIPIIGITTFAGGILFEQVKGLQGDLPELTVHVKAAVLERLPSLQQYWEANDLTQRLQTLITEQNEQLANGIKTLILSAAQAGKSAFALVSGAMGWAVLPVYLAFLLMANPLQKPEWGGYLPFLKPGTRKDVIYLINEFISIMVSFFRGQFLVALGQGLLFAIGFSIIGLKYGFLIGLLLGFLNIIPYLGSMVGLGVALPLAFFQFDGGAKPTDSSHDRFCCRAGD